MGTKRKQKASGISEENTVRKPKKPNIISSKLTRAEYNKPANELANFLLGKIVVRKYDNKILKGRIVETECYAGGEDKASVTYGNRRTPAIEALYMQPGTAYVYMTYGMYHCFNISALEPGGAVLLRALEPIEGITEMQKLRSKMIKSSSKVPKETELCNGPSKLCGSMDIKKDPCNTLDLCENDFLWIEKDPEFSDNFEIVKTSRVGIDRAGSEWASKPLRFYIFGNINVTKRDLKAEARRQSS